MPRLLIPMNFDIEILKVLACAGDDGLKTEKIARHVFNSCNSMFSPLNYKEVHAYVTQYLIKNAKDPMSVVEKGSGHGVYRLNFKAQLAQQLVLKFSPHEEEPSSSDSSLSDACQQDLSLSFWDEETAS